MHLQKYYLHKTSFAHLHFICTKLHSGVNYSLIDFLLKINTFRVIEWQNSSFECLPIIFFELQVGDKVTQ